MAVLVTGGAGYIGSHMTWALLDAGEDVVVLDRLSTGFRWAVPPEAHFYRGDVGDANLLARIFEENAIDAIVHFAGSAIVPESVAHPLAYYQNNTANTCALVEAGEPDPAFEGAGGVARAREHHGIVREELPVTGLALSRSDPALPTVYIDA